MKILIASSIHKTTIEKLRENHDVICEFNAKEDALKDLIRDREVLIFRSGVQITSAVMSCAPNLKLILRAGSGVDNIDLNYVRQHNLPLVRIPGPGGKAVAELSFALMLDLARNVFEADRLLRQGHWTKHQMTGFLLTGKVLGIVGAGNIGTRIGKLGDAWGMEVIGCVEYPSPERAELLRQTGICLMEFDEVLERADFISIHVPLKDSTRYLINSQTIARMKKGAFLVNLARGGVVDEAALLQALNDGHLRGAALDVHEAEGEGKISPLAGLPNVVLTPHIGAETFDSQREIGEVVLQTIERFIEEQASSLLTASFASELVI